MFDASNIDRFIAAYQSAERDQNSETQAELQDCIACLTFQDRALLLRARAQCNEEQLEELASDLHRFGVTLAL